MEFIALNKDDNQIQEMSIMATAIVREHFDPLIGQAQNDYMISKFQTPESIKNQLEHGSHYFFVQKDHQTIGFLAFYPRGNALYLSKFYLYKAERGKGYAHEMMAFVAQKARDRQLSAIEFNVNKHNDACRAYEKLGFKIIRSEKNDIGHGFYMDDYVYRLDL